MKTVAAESLQSAASDQTTITERFQSGQVLTISAGHFFHDIYSAFVPALLPVVIDKLSMSLAMAGTLTAIQQLPGVLNPFIGYLADKISLRYFVILAPALTATLISSLGLAPNYLALVLIFLMAGVSTAAFHAPAPAMIGRISGKSVGKGMSYFMAAGEMARTVGPLVAVWAISLWTLDGIYRLSVIGWATSLVLYWRLRSVPARTEANMGLRRAIPAMRRLFIPIMVFTVLRGFLAECLVTYLPLYMDSRGASLWIAGASLSLLEVAGVAGALFSGTFSDRLGRKPILLIAAAASSALTLLFLNIQGWVLVPVLLLLGFTCLSTTPVLLAMVQEHLPEHRALGNGVFMLISFALRPIAILSIGFMGDRFGLTSAFYASALISLISIPAILALPSDPHPLPD